MKDVILGNLARIRDNIEAACARVHRDPSGVKIIAVTKYVSEKVLEAALDCGLLDIGENRVAGLTTRAEHFSCRNEGTPTWHMVGHLQRRKTKQLLPHCRIIHSVDTVSLAEEIHHQAEQLNITIEVLLQINTSGEPQKHGFKPHDLEGIVPQISGLSHLRCIGAMTMAPFFDERARTRPVFVKLQECAEQLAHDGLFDSGHYELSMGMTNDYVIAVEEGATMVRIGSALFEGIIERSKK